MSLRELAGRSTAGLAALALCLAAAPLRGQVEANALVNRFRSAVSDDLTCRTADSNLFADIPGTARDFTIGGGSDEEVVAIFSGNWPGSISGVDAGVFIRLLIDGVAQDPTSQGGGVLVHDGESHSVSHGTHGFTFVTEPLSPGAHTAEIQWSDNALSGTRTICVRERSLVILQK